jgi:hypothetical protein
MLTEVTLPDTFTSAGLSDKGNKWVAFSDAGKKQQISVIIRRFEKRG